MERLEKSTVVVIGLGGVGSWTTEALARTNIGKLILVDLDEVCVSNSNRQLCALTSTVGKPKAEVLKERCKDINPWLEVETILDFVDASNVEKLCFPADVIIDAIDSAEDKVAILRACAAKRVPLVSVGAAGGKSDPTRVKIVHNGFLNRTDGDPLFRKVRKLSKAVPFSRIEGALIFSNEIPKKPPDDSLRKSGCDQAFGTAAFLVGAFGLAAAKAAIDILLSSNNEPLDPHTQKKIATAAVGVQNFFPGVDNTTRKVPLSSHDDPSYDEDFVELDCPCSDFGAT